MQSGGQNTNLSYLLVQASEINSLTNRLTANVSYDGAGQMLTDGKFRGPKYEYNPEGRMKWSANLDGSNESTTVYDGLGQRVQTTQGGVTKTFFYDINGTIVAEYAGGGSTANLALNRPATQSSDLGGGVASRAVDGNTSGTWANSSVTHTNYEAGAWWQVDLGGMQAVQSVEVWNRTDCCGERLTNFNVLLLDSNQAVIASVNMSGQAGTPSTVPISGTARYVKVQRVGTDYLSLAEVKVWGASGGGSSSTQIQWLVADQLGTPRMIIDKTGALANVKRHDYLPFGEELAAGTGGRTTDVSNG